MPGTDRDLVSRLLKQSILALCREAVSYTSRLEVDGIVCVTLDDNTDHVVKIHELFCKREPPSTSTTEPQPPKSVSHTQSASRHTDREHTSATVQQLAKTINQAVSPLKQFEVKVEPGAPAVTSVVSSQHSPRNAASPIQTPVSPATVSSAAMKQEKRQQSQSATPMTAPLTVSQARNITCKKCNCIIDNAKDFENHNTDAHGFYTCMVCLATFTSRNNMKRHLRLHTGVKPYTCSTCQESFSRNDDYKRHLLRHSFDKPFRCTVCKTGYSDRSCVKTHMLKEHGAKVFHICPQCGASFTDAQKYLIHKKTHPEFQDYRCELCSFTGSNALMYNKHMLTHGTPKRYMCGHCEVSFNDPFTYTNHMKRHKGDDLVQTYICCFCDHVAPTFEQFQRHEHSHVQSKQHVCAVCNKQFRYPSNLREHMLTHMPKSALTMAIETSAATTSSGPEIRPTLSSTNEEQLQRSEKAAAAIAAFSDLSNSSSLKLKTNETESEFVGDEEDADMDTCDNVGSDYWCTECNQGFGTEDLLQDHILHTHEDVSEIPESAEEHIDADRADSVKVDSRTNDSVGPRESTPVGADSTEESDVNPYELNTQLDSPSDSPYEEETCSNLVHESSKHKQEQKMNVYEEQTQMDVHVHKSSSKQHVATMKARDIAMFAKGSRAYDEETVIDEEAGTIYQDDVMKDADKPVTSEKSPVKFSTVEMAIVEDAMKEVQKIQARFRIKPSTAVGKPGATTISDIYSPLRLALNGGRDTGFTSPATGAWNLTTSANRNISWEPIRRDINRNNIPASALFPEDLSVSRKKTARFDDKSPEPTLAPKTDASSTDITSGATPYHYSKTSVLGMDTDFSATPNRGSPTTLNLQMKSPGFEKVVTPAVLFKERAPFTCEVCDQSFEEFEGAEGFDQHGISVHRRYICSWCGKPFTSRPNRERHVRYHTGEKPYKCDVCPASFFRGDDLKYHRTTKHADIRPFLCATCKAGFALPKELERHLRTYPEHRVTEQT